MSLECFRKAIGAVADFPEASPPSKVPGGKLIGLIGGEPLLHPDFGRMLEIMAERIPRQYRGLWTGLDWERTRYGEAIRSAFADRGIHNNRHDLQESRHSPVLVASADVIDDPAARAAIIDNCWLQREWCGTITPKGYFFCEVAGAFDRVFGGPGGLPVEPDCWRRPLADFQSQIDQWCQRCGIAMNLAGRRAGEECDDISKTNLVDLAASPRIQRGQFAAYDGKGLAVTATPWLYREGAAV
ncbi:MAG: radical SAM protein [Minisyncoccia bacterium]